LRGARFIESCDTDMHHAQMHNHRTAEIRQLRHERQPVLEQFYARPPFLLIRSRPGRRISAGTVKIEDS